MGRRSEAAAHYQKLQREFKATKRKVSAETDQVYREIMA
jgi:hypothetical protein